MMCGAGLILGTATVAAGRLPAQPRAAAEQRYDIPEQPLSAALASYARVSGVDILYDTPLIAGRRSATVRGTMPPQAALRTLLTGTGLSARFSEHNAAIIFRTDPRATATVSGPATANGALPRLRLDMAEVRAVRPVVIGTAGRARHLHYAETTQALIRQLVAADPDLQRHVFRIRLGLSVDAEGRVDRISLIAGSGNAACDRQIRMLVERARFAPPPPGLPAELRFEVVQDAAGGRG